MGMTNWELIKVIRDANVVRGAQRHVLFAVAIRANTKKNFTCFPSYAQLAWDSSLGDTQLRIAVRGLEKAGWIRRQPRTRTTNLFFVNVPALLKRANENQDKAKPTKEDVVDDPFGAGDLSANTPADPYLDNTDGLDAEPEEEFKEIPSWLERCSDVEAVVYMVRQMWPEHPTLADARGAEYLTSDLNKCVDIAGTSFRCAHVLHFIYDVGTIRDAVDGSKKLGLYILACFPAWMERYRDRLVGLDYEGEIAERVAEAQE